MLLIVVVVALNVAVVAAAATVTDVGTVRVALVFVNATNAPPTGAACVNVTVQLLEAFCPRVVGLQTNDDTSTGATRVIVAFAEPLLYVAVTVALWLVPIVVVVALNVADFAAAATVTDVGTVRAALVLVNATTAPPAGAGCDKIRVQALDVFCGRFVGLHISNETDPDVTRPIVAFAELLLYVAVTVALWLVPIVVVVALNVVVVAAAATVTEVGTVRVAFVFVSATTAPPAGAGCVNVTVQVLEAFGPRLVGLQASDDTSTGANRLIVVFADVLLYVAVTVAL